MAFKIPLGDLFVRLTGDSAVFDKMIDNAVRKMDRAGKKLMAIGQTMSLFVTLPLLGLGVASVKAASDAEETASKFNTVFSSVIEGATRMAQELDKSYGLSRTSSKDLLATTADLLSGFGFTQREALAMSDQVQRLAVDLASFANIEGGAEQASRALTKGLLGERESMKRLGIAINTQTDQWKRMLKEVKRTTGLVGIQATAMTTLRLATLQSKNAIGDWERTNRSFANQVREMLADLRDMRGEIGEHLLPMARVMVQAVRNMVQAWKELSPTVQKQIVTFGILLAITGPLVFGLGVLLRTLSFLATSFRAVTIAGMKWAGGILAIGTALALLTDLLGATKFGMADLISSFRIGGLKIGTMMQFVWIRLFKRWEQVKKGILEGILTLIQAYKELAATIGRVFLRAGVFIGITDKSRLDASLKSSLKSWNNFYTERARMGQALMRKEISFERQIDRILEKDRLDSLKRAEIKLPDIPELKSIPEILPQKIASLERRDQEFEVINLKQFILEGIGGLARETPKKQEVSNPVMEKKMDTLIDITKNKSSIAVLG